jgi:hypothetical protein
MLILNVNRRLVILLFKGGQAVEGSVAGQSPCARMRSDTNGKLLLFRHVSLLIGMLDDVRRGVASCERPECLMLSTVNGPVSFEPVAYGFIFPLGVKGREWGRIEH